MYEYSVHVGWKEALDFWELELQVVVSNPTRALGIELVSSGRAGSLLTIKPFLQPFALDINIYILV